jgi:hypothetical protein
MMTPAPPTAREQADEDLATAPRADCVADSAGGLTFDLTDPGGPGPAHLLLRARGADREVRLPLTPSAEGRLRAALPGTVELAEGRWDAYVEAAGSAPLRLEPGVNDLRSLVDRAPGDDPDRVAVRIPYATKHGNLTVRSWLRAPHAEAGELHIDEDGLRVSGHVLGTGLTADACVEAVTRHQPAGVVRAPLTADRSAFRCHLPYAELTEGLWDLWLRPAGEGGPRVRIARLLDDVPDKKQIFTYPKVTLRTGHGPVETRPYYTGDNDLSVKVAAVEE